MAEQTFKAPNFYEREIDISAPSTTGPIGVPAAVIGTANKGPAFVPVTVANINEFTQVFGNLDPKNLAPYAANEFLKHRSSLTYLRVLGAGSNTSAAHVSDTLAYGTVNNAGFVLSGSAALANDPRDKGVVQFLVAKHVPTTSGSAGMPMFVDNDTFNADASLETPLNLVRGLIMTPNTSRVMVLPISTAVTTLGPATNDDATVDSTGKFKLVISSSLGSNYSVSDGVAGVKVLTASFDPTDKDYIGKILNRDPDKFYQEQHYLHCDFAVDSNVAYVSSSCGVAILSGSTNTSTTGKSSLFFREVFGAYNTRYTAPETSYFISQPFGSTEYDLFKFEALDDGEYANSLYKISISNIKASVDDSNKYGTFNVQIRDWNDTDLSPVVIEQFVNCSLDPNSENYVARLIGDRKVSYNFDAINSSEKRLVSSGRYPNNSKYVRIVMASAVEDKLIPSNTLPFGFRGPSLLNITPALAAGEAVTSSNKRLAGQLSTSLSLTGSFLPPLPFRYKVTRGETSGVDYDGSPGPSEQANSSYYWGVKFERSSTSSSPNSNEVLNSNVINEKNPLIESFTKFVGIDKLDALTTGSKSDVVNNNKFTLAKVALYNDSLSSLTSSVADHMKQAAYIRNANLDSTDYTWTEGSRRRLTLASLLSTAPASTFNRFSSYAKFTNFMYGGFDGTNFLNRDSRRLNDKSVSFDAVTGGGASVSNSIPGFVSNPSGRNTANNGVASYLTAVDLVTNPIDSNNNILAIPGIREPYIADKASAAVRDYGLSMYVMDIPSYDDDNNRLYDDSVVKPNINNTTAQFDGRSIDNNYVAVYYPDVFLDDAVNRRKVKVPASVPALGALAFNDRVTYPWFAPAGFNRAALDFVTNVAVRLNSTDKDRLYESRINPIASFPRLGYVIYGQKTLQINKSALDRVNVRRLMLEIKRIIVEIAQRLVFEQNTPAVRNKFVADASFQLGLIQAQAGVEAFQVVMNESNNGQEDIDLNRLNGRIVVVPTRVVEYISIDFVVTNSGVSFV